MKKALLFLTLFFIGAISLLGQTYPSSTQVGLAAARPTFCATPGQFYYATDTSILYVSTVAGSSCVWANSTGSSAVTVNGSPLVTPGTADFNNGTTAAAQIAFVNPGGGTVRGLIANLLNPGNPGSGVMTGTQTNALTNDVWSYSGSGLWTNQTLGVPPLPITTSSYAITSANRGNRLYLGASVTALTIPQAGSAGFGADFYLDIWNLQAGPVSLTPAISTVTGGSLNVIGAAAATINPGDYCHISGNNINYFVSCTSQSDIVVPVGVDPTGTVDSYAALQASETAALNSGRELFIPAGVYQSSANISCPSSTCRIRGAGANNTQIIATGTGYNTLTVGSGTIGAVGPSGYVKDIHLTGKAKTNAGYSALQLNGVVQFSVEDVTVDTADICLDAIANNYGSQFTNVRGGYTGTCNVGFYGRAGAQSGNDITFNNVWLTGVIAGVDLYGSGGYHFRGGQITGQAPSSTDTSGAVLMGKDYLTGSTGEAYADFQGTSFEGTQGGWIVRAFSQISLAMDGVLMYPSSSGNPALGVYENTASQNSSVAFHNTRLSGYFGPTMIAISGGYQNAVYNETGTYSLANNPYISGSQTYIGSMAGQSNLQASVGYGSLGATITPAQINLGNEYLGTGVLGLCNTTPYCHFLTANSSLGAAVTDYAPLYSGTLTVTIAAGTATLASGTAVTATTCSSAVTVAATNVATTDTIKVGFAADVTGIVGFEPGAMLTVVPYPSAGDVHFKMCNNTGSDITLGSNVTLNWTVQR